MEENLKTEILYQREMNMMGLDTFSFDKHNILDLPVDRLIKNIKAEIQKSYSEHDKWIKLQEDSPDKFNELEEQAERTGHSLFIQMRGYIEDVMYLEDELFALFEMKIIYAFKHLEINIKKLLSAAYQQKSNFRRLTWESLIQYLNSKDIALKTLKGYQEVNQLRLVNNSIKHSDDLNSESFKHIPEFRRGEVLSYSDLETFYNRVKESPNEFLKSLINGVYENIYNFSDERIAETAKSIALRMDKESAVKLSEYIVKLYK